MRLTLRAKLIAIVVVGALALLALVLASSLIERRQDARLEQIQQSYVPKLGLAPRLDAMFERIGRSLQDAAASGDEDLIADARTHATALIAEIEASDGAIDPADVAPLRAAITAYVEAAVRISERLIAVEGDGDDDLERDTEAMQALRAQAAEALDEATRFDERALSAAFASASETQRTGARIRLIVSLVCIALILGLTVWIGRGLSGSLGQLTSGFRRFGAGEFDVPVQVQTDDEIGDVAVNANQMASRLRSLDWLRSGHAGLLEHVRGEMDPEEVANRAIGFLARHVGAPIGAIYYRDGAGALVTLGRHGCEADPAATALVDEAARHADLTVFEGEGVFRIRTGLVEIQPRAIALVPLQHAGAVTGVIELVTIAPWTDEATELMRAIRESLTIAIEVARARAATRALLAETQRQARELLEARRGLEATTAEVIRASAYKSEFLASMSHELRTPLNAIIGFTEIMQDGLVAPDSPQHQEFLTHILASSRHLLQLINDILDLSKVEAGKLELRPESIVLTRVVDEVLGILRTAASSARVKITAVIDPAVDALVLDPARLKQVLYNFVSNAIKFTPAAGVVTIRATPEGDDRLRLEVEDTGVGIAADDIGKLFTEFQQVGDQTGKKGTGLGLALTRRLVETQGGTVGLRSVVGQGSVFHAILPRVARTEPEPPPRRASPARSGARTVLVVEDDAADGADLARALEGAGYVVEVARSGGDALTRARARTFDAITLDLLLPDMTGLDVLRELRAGAHRDVPIVVVTVVAEPGSVAGFVVTDILPKPVDPEVLLAALTRAEVAPSTGPGVLVVDDDPSSLQLMSTLLHQLGYRSRCETDARAALVGVKAAPPTAIVLDLVMPEMSGFEFLDQLRRSPEGRDLPVIVWTSKDLSAEEHATLCASATAIVAKGRGGSQAVIAELASHLPPR